MACIDTQTKLLKESGHNARDRDYERRRKDLEIFATVTEINKRVEIKNHVTRNCLMHQCFKCKHQG